MASMLISYWAGSGEGWRPWVAALTLSEALDALYPFRGVPDLRRGLASPRVRLAEGILGAVGGLSTLGRLGLDPELVLCPVRREDFEPSARDIYATGHYLWVYIERAEMLLNLRGSVPSVRARTMGPLTMGRPPLVSGFAGYSHRAYVWQGGGGVSFPVGRYTELWVP